ncbi:hypothetical protein KY363_07595 [Candidatus Woesearchaeota archaeon]|nr:hypothetical protein [Candidatus Woesearchaeota archaeon]
MPKRSKALDYVYSDGSITDRPIDIVSADPSMPRLVLCYGYDGARQQLKVDFFMEADEGMLEKILTAIRWMAETGNAKAGTYDLNKLEGYIADKAG